ncbi:alpha-1,3-mannosyl-glycoprotein 4-beta-N-acetylglucosaminyltransferase C-like [Pecten maximus]|uniref:alpha-1,3-mannosyl-glycoprotein 4-beta-N-acetylglucosaminyltransferase C-like n=1 Tax=Pecten maximus TaxID=6579 RepID=UPI0014582246|nr:alpha-1,3-mannosyl-glycoprotein 4-beta-N-acetylglucosaminyltransferase C-like [Pecten maximus]
MRHFRIKMFVSRRKLISALVFIGLFTVTGIWMQFLNVANSERFFVQRIKKGKPTQSHVMNSYIDSVEESVTGMEYLKENAGTWRQQAIMFPPQNISKRFMTIGIPTIKRENKTYLFDTLESLFNCSTEKQREQIYIVILLADFNREWKENITHILSEKYPKSIRTGLLQVIEAPTEFYPPFKNLEHTYRRHSKAKRKWRAKQNFDYAFLFMYSKPLSTYYMQLEDDVYTVPGYLTRIRNHLLQDDGWVCLEFSELGYIGKAYHSTDLEKLSRMILLFYVEQPGDFTYMHFNSLMLQFHRRIVRPTLFQHVGLQSSLRGKIQKLKDSYFTKNRKRFDKENPPAKLFTTIQKLQNSNPLFMAYDMAGGFFWTKCGPEVNDTITIVFDTPQSIDEVIIQTGTDEYPHDTLNEGKLEASLGLIKVNNSNQPECTNNVFLGNFQDGNIHTTNISKLLGFRNVRCLRVTVKKKQKKWLIVREIALFTRENSKKNMVNSTIISNVEKHHFQFISSTSVNL